MTTRTITVSGMSCGHCVSAVQGEVSKLPGVSDVDVSLETGVVTITSDGPIDDADLAEAIDEAGYEIVP